MNDLILGIDVGTTNIKFKVQNKWRQTIFEKQVKYDIIIDNDRYEVNPLIWKNTILDELKYIFKQKFSERIVSIVTTAQMHTTVFYDSNMSILRNAILWNDKRSINIIKEIKHDLKISICDRVNEKTLAPGIPLTNLLWVKINEPEIYKDIYKISTCKDYIGYILSGNIKTDFSDASTSGCYDFNDNQWSNKILNHFGISREILPDIENSTYILGTLSNSLKKLFNVKQDIYIVLGCGDNAASYYACKKYTGLDNVLSIGTSGVLICKDNLKNSIGKKIVFKTNSHEVMISQMSLSTGGKAIEWWIKDITNQVSFPTLKDFTETKILNNSVYFIPYLSGEKYIYHCAKSFSGFFPLSLSTNTNGMTLAVIESIAFVFRLFCETKKKEDEEFLLVGGGAKNELLQRIIANNFVSSLYYLDINLGSVDGAILLGWEALNIENITPNGKLRIVPKQEILKLHYEKKFHKFVDISNEFVKMIK